MIAVVLGVLLVGAAIVVALIATSTIGGSSSSSSTTPAGAASTAPPRQAAGFSPHAVTVAVLNGTASPGLAGRTSKRLAGAGYKPGTVATASDQTNPTTVVGYLPGFRDDAVHVAAALKLPGSAIQPVASSAQAVACPPPSACTANVIVTVGADLASA